MGEGYGGEQRKEGRVKQSCIDVMKIRGVTLSEGKKSEGENREGSRSAIMVVRSEEV